MDDKKYSVELDVKNVKSANISRYADGYNYASLTFKMADKEYMSVHYEWKGNQIPEFAMQTMEIIKAIGTESAGKDVEEGSVEYLERASKVIVEMAAKMTKKKEEEVMEEDEDKDKTKKAKKKKDC